MAGPLLTSDAYELWKQSRGEDITFYQFCRFAGLSAGDRWQKVVGKLEQISHRVDQATELGKSGETVRIHFGRHNYSFPPEDLLAA